MEIFLLFKLVDRGRVFLFDTGLASGKGYETAKPNIICDTVFITQVKGDRLKKVVFVRIVKGGKAGRKIEVHLVILLKGKKRVGQ